MGKNLILQLYSLPQTVFTMKQLVLLFPDLGAGLIRRRLHYHVSTGKLVRLRPGIYAKSEFNTWELGSKIYVPSYISFETVLQQEGMIFQPYETIYLAGYLSRQIQVGDYRFHYRKMKWEILTNPEGLVEESGYHRATQERAFLDSVLVYKNYHFDNLEGLDWKRVEELQQIYSSRILKQRVREYYQEFRDNA